MTGPEHWKEADLILSEDPCEYGCPHSGCVHEMRQIARAQVHAPLALTEAYVAGAVMRPEDRDEWDRATGRLAAGVAGAGPDPDRPETWAFGEAPVQPPRPDEAGGYVCPETSDGQHCGDWHHGGKCCACGQFGPDPDEDPDAPPNRDLGPETPGWYDVPDPEESQS